MAIGMVVPIVLGVVFDKLDFAKAVALGVFFASPSDSTGSMWLKVKGMTWAILLGLLVTFIFYFLKVPLAVLIPIIGLFIFCISYLSIYGFRASLIGFSGLFALVLSFSPFAEGDISIFQLVGLIGLGGLWYMALVVFRHLLFPKSVSEFYLAETMRKTGKYLEIRSKMVDDSNDRKELVKELLELQKELTDDHEILREMLISRRRGSGSSSYQARRWLVFQELVDILEMAMANPVNYYKTDRIFEEFPDFLEDFRRVMNAMSRRLNGISIYYERPQELGFPREIERNLQIIKAKLDDSKERETGLTGQDRVVLRNYCKYLLDQFEKIKKLERLLMGKNLSYTSAIDPDDRPRFLTEPKYNLGILLDNFNLESTIFRHSLRIALVGMVGFSIGLLFEVEKPYWILLTIIVIMRPNFGLTKTRLRQRAIGTVIGGLTAFVVIMLFRNPPFITAMSILSFVIGFSMVQRNYKAAASFLTMYILFVYALLQPEVFDVIQYRVLDTLIGALLAFGGNLLLWPAWEIKSIDKTLEEAVGANRKFLRGIADYYEKKPEDMVEYKLLRKEAFLQLSELSSSFQRMTQEPKTQHKNLDEVFQLVMLMHSFLASLASLGTYITHNPTTPASREFHKIVDSIDANLETFANNLGKPSSKIRQPDSRQTEKLITTRLQNIVDKTSQEDNIWVKKTVEEEAHLIAEQLRWLLSMSDRMNHIVKDISFKNRSWIVHK